MKRDRGSRAELLLTHEQASQAALVHVRHTDIQNQICNHSLGGETLYAYFLYIHVFLVHTGRTPLNREAGTYARLTNLVTLKWLSNESQGIPS